MIIKRDSLASFTVLDSPSRAEYDRVFPITAPDPIEAIRFRMEQGGLTVKDLVPSIGQPIACMKF
jgi:HTH-type transcriptional regulator / antitoxin HigA